MSGLFGEQVDIEKAVVGVMGGWGNRGRGWCQATEWVLFTFGAKKERRPSELSFTPSSCSPSKHQQHSGGCVVAARVPVRGSVPAFPGSSQPGGKAKAESNKSNQGAQRSASLCLGAPAAESRSWPAQTWQTWLPPCSMENLGKNYLSAQTIRRLQ